jgi:ribosomal protein S24E
MEIRVEVDKENKLVGRREIEFYVLGEEKTPNKEAIKTELCKKLSLSPDGTVVTRIDQSFGAKQAKGFAHAYKDTAALKKFEPSYLEERQAKRAKKAAGGGTEAEAATAPAAAGKKEEKEEKK